MRKPIVMRTALVLAAVLVASSCGGDDDAGTTAGGAPAGGLSATATGVTADSIKIGVTYPDLEAVKEIIDLDYGDFEATYQALFDDINDRGGIGGRQIEAVYAPINPIDPKSAADACTKLIEEDEVFLSVGFFNDDEVLCHVDEHESAVIGGTQNPDRLKKAKAPWYTTSPSTDLQTDAIREFNEAEIFGDKFALFAIDTDEALLKDAIEPALEEFGLKPLVIGVASGDSSDPEAATADALRIAEEFEAAGVTQVLAVGSGAISWANAIEPLSYRPQSLFVSGSEINIWLNDAATRDLSFLEGAVSSDIYGGRINQYREPNMRLCIGILSEHGIDIPEPTDGPAPKGVADPFSSALTACKDVALLEALLVTASDDLTYDRLRTAIDEVGDLDMPASARRYRYGNPPSADGDAPISLFDFDPAKASFEPRDT